MAFPRHLLSKLSGKRKDSASSIGTNLTTPESGTPLTSPPATPPLTTPSTSSGKYGLFKFSASDPGGIPESSKPDLKPVDIIAVHGLGGNWKSTWEARNGADRDNSSIWLRDRLPPILAKIGVEARIKSFGYDSDFVFSRSVSDLDSCAQDLISRLKATRRIPENRSVPIIFIAHSLGGLLVKQSLNLAWTRSEYYRDVLDCVKGCLFLGVPHHGAGLANWAEHSVQILKLLSAGFLGNTNHVRALKSNSPMWLKISSDFVDRGRSLSFRSFYETEKIGNVLVVDRASAAMHLPNEHVFPLLGSNHRSIARFRSDEDERFALVGVAICELVEDALSDQGIVVSGSSQTVSTLPVSCRTFFGREAQLTTLKETLDPNKPGRKGVILCGLGGSGKTQIALRYIDEHKALYGAILWINAASDEFLNQSYSEALSLITGAWPERDLPIPYRGESATHKVTSRLRSTLHRRWLLILDSCDQVLPDLRELIPNCQHGSIIVSSNKRQVAEVFEAMGFFTAAVDGLDVESSQQLVLASAGPCPLVHMLDEASTKRLVRNIVKELNYLPLALEQAGGLLRKGIVTLESFVDSYRLYYTSLMEQAPPRGIVEYDRSITMAFSMLFSSIQQDSAEAAALLTFLGILGHWAIPFSALRRMGDFHLGQSEDLVRDIEDLRKVLTNEIILRLRLRQLEDVFLLKISEGPLSHASISLHPAITQWIQETVTSDKSYWIVYSGLALTKNLFQDLNPFMYHRIHDAETMNRAYIPLLDRNLSLVKKHSPVSESGRCDSNLSIMLATINTTAAFVFLFVGRYEAAVQYLTAALELDVWHEATDAAPDGLKMKRLYALAIAHQKLGHLETATEILTDVLVMAGDHFGYEDEKTMGVDLRLKAVLERLEVDLRHHKNALLATTAPGGKMRHQQPEAAASSSSVYSVYERKTQAPLPVPNLKELQTAVASGALALPFENRFAAVAAAAAAATTNDHISGGVAAELDSTGPLRATHNSHRVLLASLQPGVWYLPHSQDLVRRQRLGYREINTGRHGFQGHACLSGTYGQGVNITAAWVHTLKYAELQTRSPPYWRRASLGREQGDVYELADNSVLKRNQGIRVDGTISSPEALLDVDLTDFELEIIREEIMMELTEYRSEHRTKYYVRHSSTAEGGQTLFPPSKWTKLLTQLSLGRLFELPVFYQLLLGCCGVGAPSLLQFLLTEGLEGLRQGTKVVWPDCVEMEDIPPPLFGTDWPPRLGRSIAQLPLLLGFLYASNRGHHDTLRVLFSSPKFDINGRIRQGLTPLMYAVKSQDLDVLDMLASTWPFLDANLADCLGRTALHYAVIQGNAELVRAVLAIYGIDTLKENYAGRTALDEALRYRTMDRNRIEESEWRDSPRRTDPNSETVDIICTLIYQDSLGHHKMMASFCAAVEYAKEKEDWQLQQLLI